MIERHGSLELSRALAPAIELAEVGYPVAPITAHLWGAARSQLDASPGGRALLVDGRAPRPGERFRNPELARTFRVVTEHGKDGFYRGEIAEAFFQAVEGMQWVTGIWIERMDWFDQFARPPEGWYFDATVESSPRRKPAEDIIARWFLP